MSDARRLRFCAMAARTNSSCASWSTQSKPTEPKNALQVCQPHLDLLSLTSRRLVALGANKRPGDVPGLLVDVARDLARWLLWAALRFERAYIAVELRLLPEKAI